MRAVRLPVGIATAVLALVAALAAVPTTAPGAAAGPPTSVQAVSQAGAPWSPPVGVLFNNPRTGAKRAILARVIRAINATPRGETIRIAVWNFDDYPTRRALIGADKRGVNVKVVVAGSVANRNWTALARQLNRRTGDPSYARRCSGGCRSASKIMHSKVFLFSRIGRQRAISMYGSSNLTTPAGNRQWNDLVTLHSLPTYRVLRKTFEEYAKDRAIRPSYRRYSTPPFRTWVWPLPSKNNTILEQLRGVKCRGAIGMPGGRTKIRIAIAGWFDAFGNDIARRVRYLWNHGCNIKIITTLAGRGVNRTLKAGYGRGPVPINRIGMDNNNDGVPEKYLHMKAMVVKGVYGGDRTARLLWSGSPNWSARAARSEEVLLRWNTGTGVVDRYIRQIDSLYSGPSAYAKSGTTARTSVDAGTDPLLTRYTDPDAPALPEWFQLD